MSVTLPDVLNARLEVVEDACRPEEFEATRNDPERGLCRLSRIGTAVATTPLLRDPLRGNVYLVERVGRPTGLPNIVVALRGQVDFDLLGRVAVPGGRLLRATFPSVPDVPVSRFVLQLEAGRRGVVGVARRLCSRHAARSRATVNVAGQSRPAAPVRTPLVRRGCEA